MDSRCKREAGRAGGDTDAAGCREDGNAVIETARPPGDDQEGVKKGPYEGEGEEGLKV